MLKQKYENWTKEFMESWKNLDWKRTLKTLSEDVEYYENPIDKPCVNFEEVTNLWSVVADNQKDIDQLLQCIKTFFIKVILQYQIHICKNKPDLLQITP